MVLRQFVPGTGPPAPVCLEIPPKASSHQVTVFLMPAERFAAFRRRVEKQTDNILWLTQSQLRQGELCRQLLRWEAEGFAPPDGVFVSWTQALLPEDADDLCPAMEYYFRFALPPSQFCVLTTNPGLGTALAGAWERYLCGTAGTGADKSLPGKEK